MLSSLNPEGYQHVRFARILDSWQLVDEKEMADVIDEEVRLVAAHQLKLGHPHHPRVRDDPINAIRSELSDLLYGGSKGGELC